MSYSLLIVFRPTLCSTQAPEAPVAAKPDYQGMLANASAGFGVLQVKSSDDVVSAV